MGLSEDSVSRLLNGKRKLDSSELALACEFLNEVPPIGPVHKPATLTYVKVVGAVAAGAFMQDHMLDFVEYDIPYVVDPKWPLEAVKALRVEGESINRKASHGDHVVILLADFAPRAMQSGDWVVAESTKGDLRERTVKRVRGNDLAGYELWPDSTDERYQEPIKLGADGRDRVSVIAFVLDFIKAGTRF